MRNSARNVLLAAAGLLICVAPLVPTSSAMQDEKLRLDKPAPVLRKRMVKKKRITVTEHVPLLRIEWSVVQRDEDERARETSTDAIFHDGDRLRIRIKSNQKGYLHIFQNTEGQDNGEQVFPDSGIRHGSSLVNGYEEIVIPSECAREFRYEDGSCWLAVKDPAGLEVFTVILSREAIPRALKGISGLGGKISLRDLAKIKDTPSRMTSREVLGSESSGGSGPHAITVSNMDTGNNEELIVRIRLNHKGTE